ncbi:MAG: coproporphyrinogen III oxidase [Rubrivivax sp.]
MDAASKVLSAVLSPVLARACGTADAAGSALAAVPAPRYVVYPETDRFVEAFGSKQLLQAMRQRSAAAAATALAVNVHIPFRASRCNPCSGRTMAVGRDSHGADYLKLLAHEIELASAALGPTARVDMLHLVSRSPTVLTDDELAQLLALLQARLRLEPGADRTIDADSRTIDVERLHGLHRIGFNHINFGIVDLDPVMRGAGRLVHDVLQVRRLVQAAAALGFRSSRVDLVCGLPRQTVASFRRALALTIDLAPHRIAVHVLDHPTQRYRAHGRVDARAFPHAGTGRAMLDAATTDLVALGYRHIGMELFALPEDQLAVARRQGRLQRGPQGFTTHPGGILGLGVSALSRFGATYSQNALALGDYRERLAQQQLPVVRGLALSRDDLLRRSVIMGLLCQGRVDFEAIAIAHLQDPRVALCAELSQAAKLAQRGLLRLTESAIELTTQGLRCAATVAATFDRYRMSDARRERNSHVT